MSPPRMCLRCNQLALPGKSRCAEHAIPQRSGTSRRNSRNAVEGATYCYLCGEPARPDDPLVADHIIPRVLGGSDDLYNLAPAHRSCNGRKSANLAGFW
jgi:5-methylcytosine-specific restriction endonuclease McrA